MAALSPLLAQGRATTAAIGGRIREVREPPNSYVNKVRFVPTLTTVAQPVVPAGLLGGTAKFRVNVPRGSVDRIGAVTLQFGITIATSPVQLAATPLWLDRAVIVGNSEPHAQLQGDALLTNLLAATAGSQWECVSKTVNMMGDGPNVNLGPTPMLQPGNYRFNLPIVGSFFHFLQYYMGKSGEDLMIDLFPAGNIIAAGAGTVTVTGINVLIEGDKVEGERSTAILAGLLATPQIARYLDPVLVPKFNQALTAGAANIFDLNSVRGVASHAAIIVRAAGATNAGSGMMKMYNLGDADGATFDIQNAASQSILGNGTPVPLSYNRFEWWCKSFSSSFSCNKPLYVVPLCNSVPAAYRGTMDGGLLLTGDSKKLVLNLPAAPVSEVQTFTASGVAASGFYRFFWKGELSAALAFDATAATMKAAFEAMKVVQAKSITVTFSGPATATFTGTFTHPETHGLSELVQLESTSLATAGAAAVNIPTTLTTQGTTGIATGQYDVYIYFWLWRQISCTDGRLESYQLV
jgi:hypothetical protein